jgi:hypothetical protein
MANDIYLRRGLFSVKFDKDLHNYEQMIAEGWIQYDPLAQGDAGCTDTHRNGNTKICKHGYSWWCPQAPHDMWYPDALYKELRSLDRVIAARKAGRI